MTNKVSLLVVLVSSLFITACGGGASSSTNNTITKTEPRAINHDNWHSARLIQTQDPMTNSLEVIGTELVITIESADISENEHLQIYLNTDNKAETGFQFEGEAWQESGVDYIIEDGDLFKSTANNTGWNWNTDIGEIDYSIEADIATIKIDLALLGDICNNLKVGIMTRDEFWDISTFSPASSLMQNIVVNYCNTTVLDVVGPEITLIGAQPTYLTVGDVFIDPGATAYDNVNGDVSSSITSTSNVDTSTAGIYEIIYTATDFSGNSSSFARIVVVDNESLGGIIIDGDSNDWSDIATFSSSANAIMKVSDDEDKLYILVTSSNLGENIQVLMDTDNDATTGLSLSAQISSWLAGADYMIENNSLDKSTNNMGWSWDYGISPIEYIKTTDTLEIAIVKSDLNQLTNTIPMGFVSRTSQWNVNYILPEESLPIYTLQFPVEVNPVTANNDSVTTANNEVIQIDVLANDSSATESTLTISPIIQAQFGNVTVTQNKVIYTPDPLFTGIDTFIYQISDISGNTDTATIKVIVTEPSNIAPVAENDSSNTLKNQSTIIDVLNNDTDLDDDVLTLLSVSPPLSGTAQIIGNTIKYTPNIGFNGTDTFNYTVTDGNDVDTANVTITVINTVPAANDDVAVTPANNPITIQVLSNDIDEDGDTLTLTTVTSAINGATQKIGNTIKYTPNDGFTGTDTFDYTIIDESTSSDTATVTITITNTAPAANNDTANTIGINTVRIAVLDNDTDADNHPLTIIGFTQPTDGSITLTTSTATFNYTPNATFAGTDTFTYTVSDSNGGTDTATVSITVPVNNEPDAVEDVADVFFDQTITIDVLSNDTDPDNDILSVQSIVQPPNGIATLNEDGTIFFDPQNTVGSISIGYTVTDGRGGTDFAVLTVSSTDPNDGNDAFPDITNEFVSTPSNTSIFIPVLANDSDADGDILVLDQVDQGENGITQKVTQNGVLGVLYTPNPGFIGTDIFYYGVHDGFGHNGSGFVEVTVGLLIQ